MPYRSMNLEEVARMLGADVRRIERMAKRGDIPCRKVHGQLRFNRAEITEWLQRSMGAMSHDHLAEVDAGITTQRQTQQDEAIITPLLQAQAVSTSLGSRTKNSTLRELVALADKTGLVIDLKGLLEAVIHREELCSTAIERGIAIPHPRRPLPDAIVEPILAVARTSHGIAFGAPDGRLSTMFFLTASQDDRHHLHILARLCRVLHDEDFVNRLEAAETCGEMIDLMKNRERDVLA